MSTNSQTVDPSSIFERSVQESTSPAGVESPLPDSPSLIPAHIQSEDLIPPVLAASTHAITDDKLDPEGVEIVTHVLHQPAAAAVIATSGPGVRDSFMLSAAPSPTAISPPSLSPLPLSLPLSSALAGPEDAPESLASNEGPDMKRLSFISYADLVLGEQFAATRSGPPSVAGIPPSDLSTLSSRARLGSPGIGPSQVRATSGMTSPATNEFLPSPPTSSSSRSTSFRQMDGIDSAQTRAQASSTLASPPTEASGTPSLKSPRIGPVKNSSGQAHLGIHTAQAARRPTSIAIYPSWSLNFDSRPQSPNSPMSFHSGHSVQHGQVIVETMGQALRRTVSGDFVE